MLIVTFYTVRLAGFNVLRHLGIQRLVFNVETTKNILKFDVKIMKFEKTGKIFSPPVIFIGLMRP